MFIKFRCVARHTRRSFQIVWRAGAPDSHPRSGRRGTPSGIKSILPGPAHDSQSLSARKKPRRRRSPGPSHSGTTDLYWLPIQNGSVAARSYQKAASYPKRRKPQRTKPLGRSRLGTQDVLPTRATRIDSDRKHISSNGKIRTVKKSN